MKEKITLSIASTLSVLFVTVHIADDVARGLDKGGALDLLAVPIFVGWLYGALVLGERRSGYVIMLLGSLLTMLVPFLHMKGAHYGEIAASPGGFFFVWVLWALALLGGFSLVLSVRGLFRRSS